MVGIGSPVWGRADGEGTAEAETAVTAMRQRVIEVVYFMVANLLWWLGCIVVDAVGVGN